MAIENPYPLIGTGNLVLVDSGGQPYETPSDVLAKCCICECCAGYSQDNIEITDWGTCNGSYTYMGYNDYGSGHCDFYYQGPQPDPLADPCGLIADYNNGVWTLQGVDYATGNSNPNGWTMAECRGNKLQYE